MNDILREIYDIYSISNGEKDISNYLKNKYQLYGYDIVEDNLYSVFFNKKGKINKKLMIAFPLDEIGLMIANNEDTLDFIFLEDISPLNFINQRVNIISKDYKNIPGIIEIERKLMEDNKSEFNLEKLYIDALGRNKEVNIGDLVGLDTPLIKKNNLFIGRSLNQKIFQYISIEIAKKLRNETIPLDLYMGGVSQSTIGFRGTKTATYVIKPDIAIALSGFETKKSEPKINCGDGIVIGLYDKQMLPNQNFIDYMKNNYKITPYIGNLGNDGSFIHKTIRGASTISLGIPMTNLGTGSVIVSQKDINTLINFLYEFIINFSYEEVL